MHEKMQWLQIAALTLKIQCVADSLIKVFCAIFFNRFMTKAQLCKKIKMQTIQLQKERRQRQAFEDALLDMHEDDHSDLESIMNKTTKNDIPDNLKLLWDQQKSVLEKTTKSQYRWHPRCVDSKSRGEPPLYLQYGDDPLNRVYQHCYGYRLILCH